MGRQSILLHLSTFFPVMSDKITRRETSRGKWRKTTPVQGLAQVEISCLICSLRDGIPTILYLLLSWVTLSLIIHFTAKTSTSPFPSTPSQGWSPRASIYVYIPQTCKTLRPASLFAIFLDCIIFRNNYTCCCLGIGLAFEGGGQNPEKQGLPRSLPSEHN